MAALLLGALTASVAHGAPGPATAAPRAPGTSPPSSLRARLEWSVPPSADCASGAEVVQEVEALLGIRALTTEAAPLPRLVVQVEPTERGWLARIDSLDVGGSSLGSRRLHTPEASCHSLDGPIALVLALMAETMAPPSEPAVVLELPESPPSSAFEADEGWAAEWRLAAVGSAGLLPGFALGAELSVGVTPPGFVPIVIRANLWPGADETTDGRGGTFSAWHAGLGVCPGLTGDDWGGVGVCIGAEAGTISATGIGLDRTASPLRALVAPRADVRLWLAVGGPFLLHVQAGAAVPLLRPRYRYDGPDGQAVDVHRPWPVVPIGAAGLGFELGP